MSRYFVHPFRQKSLCFLALSATCWIAVGADPAHSSRICVSEHYAAAPKEGEVAGIAPDDAEALVAEIAAEFSLSAASIEIIACPYVEKAIAFSPQQSVGDSNRLGAIAVPPGQYIIYNPTWVREVIGNDRWLAVALFGHELGHFLNFHFSPGNKLSRLEKEEEADSFAGCAVAALGGDWETLRDLLSRIRREGPDTDYPNRLKSLEKARQGYFRCAPADPGAAGSSRSGIFASMIKEPVNNEEREHNIAPAAVENGLYLGARDFAEIQKVLNSIGYPAGSENGVMGEETRNALKRFQYEYGLNDTGFVDETTMRKLASTYNTAPTTLKGSEFTLKVQRRWDDAHHERNPDPAYRPGLVEELGIVEFSIGDDGLEVVSALDLTRNDRPYYENFRGNVDQNGVLTATFLMSYLFGKPRETHFRLLRRLPNRYPVGQTVTFEQGMYGDAFHARFELTRNN